MSSDGLFFAGDGQFKVESAIEIFKEILAKTLVFELNIIDGGEGEYNAHYTLERFEIHSRIDMLTWRVDYSESARITLAEGDMKTTPDSSLDGVSTLNGTYTWKNVTHRKKDGLPVVQVLQLNGSPVLPTTAPNVNAPYVGKMLQDGINIHPPNPNGALPWVEKYESIVSKRPGHNAFSRGCWQPRPDLMGKHLIDTMREVNDGIKRINLITTANSKIDFKKFVSENSGFNLLFDVYRDWMGKHKEFFGQLPH